MLDDLHIYVFAGSAIVTIRSHRGGNEKMNDLDWLSKSFLSGEGHRRRYHRFCGVGTRSGKTRREVQLLSPRRKRFSSKRFPLEPVARHE